MAGVLTFRTSPLLRPASCPRRSNRRVGFRVCAEIREASSPEKLGVSSDSSLSSKFSAPSDFKAPEPKKFFVRSDKSLDVFTASLGLFFRFGSGVFVAGYSATVVSDKDIAPGEYVLEVGGTKVKETSKLGPRPDKPIEIYEFESCPFCRKVREIVAILDLDVLFYPCPRNGPNFRSKVAQLGGKQQFPYMVDPNTGVSMYESDDIIKYLVGKYGDGSVPLSLSLGLLTTLTAGLAMIGRIGKGTSYIPSKLPPQPLEIWAYEGSPFCKLVREVLVELELPHLQRTCARGSLKRQILLQETGHFQVPYLNDPNTGVKMFESAEIVEYLRATYALA